jgi:hypothetical protein
MFELNARGVTFFCMGPIYPNGGNEISICEAIPHRMVFGAMEFCDSDS